MFQLKNTTVKKTEAIIIIIACLAILATAAGSYWFYRREARREQIEFMYQKTKVTIPEGLTALQADDLLFDKGIIAKRGSVAGYDINSLKGEYPFLEASPNLEGFLFPDTYEFYKDSNAQVVVRKILDNFKEKTRSQFGDKIPSQIYKELIEASLIEEEIKNVGNDRKLVASLIERRIAEGMYLNIDASLCYARSKRGCEGRPLTAEDKKINSGYNTYIYRGLPPTPIANPGLSAIEAVEHPIESEYLYYLTDPKTDKTIFSTTLDEHNKNIAKYLR